MPPGLGEAYMDGDYEVDDLGGLLAVATANANNIEVGSRPCCSCLAVCAAREVRRA